MISSALYSANIYFFREGQYKEKTRNRRNTIGCPMSEDDLTNVSTYLPKFPMLLFVRLEGVTTFLPLNSAGDSFGECVSDCLRLLIAFPSLKLHG